MHNMTCSILHRKTIFSILNLIQIESLKYSQRKQNVVHVRVIQVFVET